MDYYEYYRRRGWEVPTHDDVVARKGDDMGFFTAVMGAMAAASVIIFAAYILL